MQVAIISDIHSNRHAFEAVLADVRGSSATEIWCLGDIVGYGADASPGRTPPCAWPATTTSR
jgi:predicted phosphodiesterase